MTLNIQTFPAEWYQFVVGQKFNTRSMNQSAGRPWGGAGAAISSRPHTQLWVNEVTMAPLADHMAPEIGPVLQDIGAFIQRAKGRSGIVRMSWGTRLMPWHDRALAVSRVGFSDGSSFSDGSLFLNGMLPPAVHVEESANRGANYLVLGGFPANMPNALRRGDLLEIKPGGIAAPFPHLYSAMFGGDTDAQGRIGIEINIPLRQGVNANDTVSLRSASTLFHLADDNQGDVEGTGGEMGNLGFSLIEALDLVP